MQLHISSFDSQQASAWSSTRQPFPSPSGDSSMRDENEYGYEQRAQLTQDGRSYLAHEEYNQQWQRQRQTLQNGVFDSASMMNIDILSEAAKRAEMEILASDIGEMQF